MPIRVVLVAMAVFSALVSAQQPVFRTAVRAIQVDAVVTDEAGSPVRGLTVEDFEVTENGLTQPITTFEAVDIPIEPFPPDLADSDVVSNEAEGRIYLIVIDDLLADNGMRARRFLRRFLDDHFGPNDRAAVMLLHRGHANAGQDFTSNRRLLARGIDSFVGETLPPNAAPGSHPRTSPGDASPGASLVGQSSALVRDRMARLRELTEFLVKIPGGRKAMILVSEAIGFSAFDFIDYRGGVLSLAAQDAHAAMTAATRGNVAIYPIDPAGLTPEGAGARNLERVQELRALGDATGGFALVNSNDYDGTFKGIVLQNSVYYMLGFNSAYEKSDGRYVRMQVRVKKPGLRVHAREGYVAPFSTRPSREGAPVSAMNPVAGALASPVPVGGVAMRATAAAFKGSGRTAAVAVAVRLDPSTLGLVEQDGTRSGIVELRMIATDVRNKALPEVRHVAVVKARADEYEQLAREGVVVVSKVELQPGRYQLRIAAGTPARGGSVVYDLDVPDFTRGALQMSGVMLLSGAAPDLVMLHPNDPMRANLSRAPVLAREFSSADTLAIFAEIYARSGTTREMAVRVDLHAEDGSRLPAFIQVLRPEEVRASRGVVRLDARLALAGTAPGRYVLNVEVRAQDDADVVRRAIPIRIVAVP